jgi:CDP-diacylglycerol--glycerol-3-phosphate 3-phosphatidyltransferase
MSLTLMRIIIAILLLIDGLDGRASKYFLIGFILAWSFDVLDGFLARKLKVTSAIGAIIDGLADLTLYGCVITCVFHIYPSIASSLYTLVFIGIIAQLIHDTTGLLKFHKMVSYHSILAKVISVMAFLSILEIFSLHSYHLAQVTLILWIFSNMEGVSMTLILPNYVNNVSNILVAIQYNRAAMPNLNKRAPFPQRK